MSYAKYIIKLDNLKLPKNLQYLNIECNVNSKLLINALSNKKIIYLN